MIEAVLHRVARIGLRLLCAVAYAAGVGAGLMRGVRLGLNGRLPS
ncbi:hypothetical protein [Oceanomicrobium pacificus]|nr:hypothetical protein [Oceanomicrobium pacificus]